MRDTSNNRFPGHFRDFIEELNKHSVEYLVIGGYAMGSYGHFRGTGDLDIFVNATEANITATDCGYWGVVGQLYRRLNR